MFCCSFYYSNQPYSLAGIGFFIARKNKCKKICIIIWSFQKHLYLCFVIITNNKTMKNATNNNQSESAQFSAKALRDGKTFSFSNERTRPEDARVATVSFREDPKNEWRTGFTIWFNGQLLHFSKTFAPLSKRLGKLMADWDLELIEDEKENTSAPIILTIMPSAGNDSAQTSLVKTYQKLILTPEEKEMDIFDVMEKHFPINTNPLKEQREYNLRISILEIASEIGCIDAATSFLNDHSNGLAQLSNYHKALAEIYYSQSKQAA